jgi:hypothetical protein
MVARHVVGGVVAEVGVFGVSRPTAGLLQRLDHRARRGDRLHLVCGPVEVPARDILERRRRLGMPAPADRYAGREEPGAVG